MRFEGMEELHDGSAVIDRKGPDVQRLGAGSVGRTIGRARLESVPASTEAAARPWAALGVPLLWCTALGLSLIRAPALHAAQLSHHHPAVYCSVSRSIAQTNITWRDILHYKFQQVMSRQMFGKLVAVFVAAFPIVVVGGLLYKLAAKQPFASAMYKAYTIMSDLPGADAVEEENPLALVVGNLVFFAGMFTVAVTLGIVCDDISSFVSDVRHGNYQMVEDGHTVILNTNPLLGPILRQIALAAEERGTFKSPIVILADVDKEELEELVGREAEGLNLQISTRQGCTHSAVDLKRVAAGKARCVIWLEPDDKEIFVAARRACAIATLKALGSGNQKAARLVVQTHENTVKSAKHLTNVPLAFRTPPLVKQRQLQVLELYEEENFDRLMAQCALQPGLSTITSHLLQHDGGKEFYATRGENFGGMLYRTARRHCHAATACGIYTPPLKPPYDEGTVQLNPPDETVLREGDQLIVLSETKRQAVAKSASLPEGGSWVEDVQRQHKPSWARHVVVLCFGGEGTVDSGVVDALAMFAPKGTKVTVVAKSRPETLNKNGNCSFSFIEGDPSSFQTLKEIKNRDVDSVVLAGLEDMPPKIADAQLISSLIQIQEVAAVHWKDKTGFSVVSPVNFLETKEVADHLIEQGRSLPVPIELDVLLPSELASGILVQVAGAPMLDAVFKELVQRGGSELYLRDAVEFDLIGRGPIKSHQVMEITRKHGETFLGILKRDRSVEMAPGPMTEHEYAEGERIVVLADGFEPDNGKEP